MTIHVHMLLMDINRNGEIVFKRPMTFGVGWGGGATPEEAVWCTQRRKDNRQIGNGCRRDVKMMTSTVKATVVFGVGPSVSGLSSLLRDWTLPPPPSPNGQAKAVLGPVIRNFKSQTLFYLEE
jgi:hypothetical protein